MRFAVLSHMLVKGFFFSQGLSIYGRQETEFGVGGGEMSDSADH